jgi:hypothetical protein
MVMITELPVLSAYPVMLLYSLLDLIVVIINQTTIISLDSISHSYHIELTFSLIINSSFNNTNLTNQISDNSSNRKVLVKIVGALVCI